MAALFGVWLVPDLSVLWSGEDFDFWQFTLKFLKVCDDGVTAVALCQLGGAKVWCKGVNVTIGAETADFAAFSLLILREAFECLR